MSVKLGSITIPNISVYTEGGGSGTVLNVFELDEASYSITNDGSYGENVISHITEANEGDTITIVYAGGATFTVHKADGSGTISATNIDSFEVGGGGGFPPQPSVIYIVYQFTMPDCTIVITL